MGAEATLTPATIQEVTLGVLVAELWAIMVIGDGVVGALFPAQHTARWAQAPLPQPWREFLQRLN
jgi:hypothetical protein